MYAAGDIEVSDSDWGGGPSQLSGFQHFPFPLSDRQYIGEHIRCITGGSIPEHVINTFCFFTTTFTVIRHYNESLLQEGVLPHPGVGPMYTEDPVKHHAYYQWVPFILFLQALTFYAPHMLWRISEGMSREFHVTSAQSSR